MSQLTISRKWNNPQITANFTNEEISLSISLEDFKTALLQEIGSVTFVFKKDTFANMVDKAINNIMQGVKDESVKVAR
jgi:hypothetical protein